jgi:hypothetical protein
VPQQIGLHFLEIARLQYDGSTSHEAGRFELSTSDNVGQIDPSACLL